MRPVHFDSFGEPIPQRVNPGTVTTRTTSRGALVAGIGIFWSLVVVIVTARAFYFNPDFASTFQQIADFVHGLRVALSV